MQLPHLRDYAKGPFLLAVILIISGLDLRVLGVLCADSPTINAELAEPAETRGVRLSGGFLPNRAAASALRATARLAEAKRRPEARPHVILRVLRVLR
jgi:hypothetical protein